MAIGTNRLEDTVGGVISAGMDRTDDLLVVNPSGDAIRELVWTVDERADLPRIRLFAAEAQLKAVLEDFLLAATVADQVADGALAVRTLESVPRNSLLVTPESVTALVTAPDQAAGLTTTEDPFVEEAYDAYDRRWARADEYPLRTPPLSRVRETLGEELGAHAVADFDGMLDAIGSTDDSGLDEVAIALLVAARNGELLYDVSKWGEDVGLASKATFSRTKTALEDAGLVDTEKVPIDVGRPRLRLTLRNGLEGDSVEQLAETAQMHLSR